MGKPEQLTPGTKAAVIVIGLVIIAVSLICFVGNLRSGASDEVTCGGSEMERDDTCVTYVNGNAGSERTYDEQAEQGGVSIFLVILALAGAAFGVFIIWSAVTETSAPGGRRR
ncbi:hypothetical protein [Glycomyces salinus]|uniref:hypothetical protein n=1 Tax=Glycomyces salinus TaxID=980294 RepID=UPI0018EDFC6B|nr:hypothetical protein [Glycomyces salinus]